MKLQEQVLDNLMLNIKQQNNILEKDNTTVINKPSIKPFEYNPSIGQMEYSKGNYSNPHAKVYSEKISGKVEALSPEFDILSSIGIAGLKNIGKTLFNSSNKKYFNGATTVSNITSKDIKSTYPMQTKQIGSKYTTPDISSSSPASIRANNLYPKRQIIKGKTSNQLNIELYPNKIDRVNMYGQASSNKYYPGLDSRNSISSPGVFNPSNPNSIAIRQDASRGVVGHEIKHAIDHRAGIGYNSLSDKDKILWDKISKKGKQSEIGSNGIHDEFSADMGEWRMKNIKSDRNLTDEEIVNAFNDPRIRMHFDVPETFNINDNSSLSRAIKYFIGMSPAILPVLNNNFKIGGKLTPQKSRLVKNAEDQNTKRDMRKKFIKSNKPTYKRPLIKKKQQGGTLETIKFDPDLFASWNSIPVNTIEFPKVDYNQKFPEITPFTGSSKTPSKIDVAKELEKEIKILPYKLSSPESSTFVNPYKGNKGKWVEDLRKAYQDSGISNENALRMLIAQDALESGWGKSAQGDYNFGNITTGSSWKGRFVRGKDRDAKGNPISQKFRAYDSMKDYAKDKIDFLKRLYDFDENDDINTFLNKLQGGNKGGRKYAEAGDYTTKVLNTYNSIKG